jgi:Coenzyme PQQ synthesis protein D (PqqD)
MSDKYIARSTAIAARVLDEEMVIMSAVDSTLFSLTGVAAVIWQAADGQTPLSEIVRDQVCAVFDVAPDEAYRDAEAFVEELARHGILQISASPIRASASAAGEGA